MTPDERIKFCVEQTQKIVQIATTLDRLVVLLERMHEDLRALAERFPRTE